MVYLVLVILGMILYGNVHHPIMMPSGSHRYMIICFVIPKVRSLHGTHSKPYTPDISLRRFAILIRTVEGMQQAICLLKRYMLAGMYMNGMVTKENGCASYSMQNMHDNDMIHYSNSGLPYKKRYLDETSGAPMSDVWVDISNVRGDEGTGYPTQKPLALYERIISASSNIGDVVLILSTDPGTTLVAAEKLGRQWIGIDMSTENRAA